MTTEHFFLCSFGKIFFLSCTHVCEKEITSNVCKVKNGLNNSRVLTSLILEIGLEHNKGFH